MRNCSMSRYLAQLKCTGQCHKLKASEMISPHVVFILVVIHPIQSQIISIADDSSKSVYMCVRKQYAPNITVYICKRSIAGIEPRTKRNCNVRRVESGPARRCSAQLLAALQQLRGGGGGGLKGPRTPIHVPQNTNAFI
jgi:hypothetical protein